jgi:hypothetical protein
MAVVESGIIGPKFSLDIKQLLCEVHVATPCTRTGHTQAYRLPAARVAMRSGVTVMSTRGSVFQRAR